AFEVQAGIGFLAAHDADPGVELILEDARGREVPRGTTDSFGSLIFRDLAEGREYVLRESAAGGGTARVRVLRFADHPDAFFYATKQPVEGFPEIRGGAP